jgi:serine-type D-Ala-D-Ala carboxypeptidase/endopeptidase
MKFARCARIHQKTDGSRLQARYRRCSFAALVILVGITLTSLSQHMVSAQQPNRLDGDFFGTLGTLHLVLHLSSKADGSTSGTLDSPDQDSFGIPCANFRRQDNSFSFDVPAVSGRWKGTLDSGLKTLSGTWSQGTPQPLDFTRDTFVPAAKPSPVDGVWLGTLGSGARALRVEITVKSDATGNEYCTLNSLDQGGANIACTDVVFKTPSFSFDVPAVKASWSGNLSPDGKTLNGSLLQGISQPLNFVRLRAANSLALPKFDSALPPILAADLGAVLAKDLASDLKNGILATGTHIGVAIGIVQNGVKKVICFGNAEPDSMFEIGSLSKTFTGLLLAQMVEQGKVTLTEPVRELLPPGAVSKPKGNEITLLDLVTHRSGLPRLPDNMPMKDLQNPYADYSSQDLLTYMRSHGVERTTSPSFLYSNLGVGLLGDLLADRAATSYSFLLQEEITCPLGMKDTCITLSQGQLSRLTQGHDFRYVPTSNWEFGALAGAGAIRSTASDMLTYLDANLHPDAISIADESASGRITFAKALVLSHTLENVVTPGQQIAFTWFYDDSSGTYCHNGATGGYSSYAFFDPAKDCAAIVLTNITVNADESSFADRLGLHIRARLDGKPAISLGNS